MGKGIPSPRKELVTFIRSKYSIKYEKSQNKNLAFLADID
jgi:hypothetical protein